jgi:hypothetical protein
MDTVFIILEIIIFFTGGYFLIKEAIKERSQKQKMIRLSTPILGRRYHWSYSLVAGLMCFGLAILFLYRLIISLV